MVETTFEIQRHEPNPHASKEAILKNRTYQPFRWKTVMVINGSRQDANDIFSTINQSNTKYRLVEA